MENSNDFVMENDLLVRYTGDETDVVIPDGTRIIGEDAFADSNVNSVRMPASVVEIGSSAFRACSGLRHIVLSENIVSIGDFSFEGCWNLESINIPKKLENIGYAAFYGCSRLSKFNLPNTVQFIGENAFTDCDSLADENGFVIFLNKLYAFSGDSEEVVIPDRVTDICTYAFHECKNIKHVVIPNTVTSIRKEAFYDCTNLTDIYVPKSVDHLAAHAFGWNVSSLTIHGAAGSEAETYAKRYGIHFLDDIDASEEGSYSDMEIKDTTLIKYTGPGGDIVIPKGITVIGEEAFALRDDINSVVIPEGVFLIGDSAFGTCRNLIHVTLPSTLVKIGENAFGFCPISSLDLPNNLMIIGDNAFQHCRDLKYLKIPPKVINIGSDAFIAMGQPNILSVEVGATVELPSYLRNKLDLDALGNVRVIFYYADYPDVDSKYDNVTRELHYMDNVCIKLSPNMDLELDLNDEGEEIYRISAPNSDQQFLVTIKKVKYVNNEFGSVSARKKLGQFVEDCLFSNNKVFVVDGDISTVFACAQTSQKMMPIFNFTVNIFQLAIQVDLNTVLLMVNFHVVEENDKSASIKELEFMLNIAKCIRVNDNSIDLNGINAKMLYDAIVLGKKTPVKQEKPKAKAGVKSVLVDNNVQMEIQGTVLAKIKGKANHVVVPDGVTEIKAAAFKGKKTLESVEIPEGVSVIKSNTFFGCSNLKTVKSPESLTSIGDNAFRGTKLETVFIPKNVKHVGEQAFIECRNLNSIVVDPDNQDVQMLGDCLVNIEEQTIVIGLGDDLPKRGIKEIFAGAFSECKKCKHVIIPEGVEKIGGHAFAQCRELISLSIPRTVTEIADAAFFDNIKLSQINVDADNPYFSSKGNALIDIREKRMFLSAGDTVIPDDGSVTVIDSFTFGSNYQKEQLVIPPTIEQVEMFAIYGFSNDKLRTVIFEGSNTKLNNTMCSRSIVIKGKKGSTAEKYAQEHNLEFETI